MGNLIGANIRKVQPKLRMFSNGSLAVNAVRSENCSSVVVKSVPKEKEKVSSKVASLAKTPSLKEISSDVEASVFVSLVRPRQMLFGESDNLPSGRGSSDGNQVLARIPLSHLPEVSSMEGVSYVEVGEPLVAPTPKISRDASARPTRSDRNVVTRAGGEGVLVGIIDVQGFDFAHEDFLNDDGTTRFERIWDQGGGLRDKPEGYDYGAEITKVQMDTAIEHAEEVGVPATVLEEQSQMVPSAHATHVASIAAGNRGVCRKAFLAGVLISLPEEDTDRRRSFYDSTRIADAVDYLFELAKELQEEYGLENEIPVSINISLGTNGAAHDGSSGLSRWIDSSLSVPGRSVCVAAGNAGQERGTSPEDIGFIMGRIHTSGRVAARGLVEDLEMVVVGNGISDISENELEVWYSAADRFAVSVTPPGQPTIGPIEPLQYLENHQLADKSMLSIYNELYHPANGCNYINIFLSPFLKQDPIGVTAGVWKIRLHGIEVRDGSFDGWIERDDANQIGVIGNRQYWRFPSFFTEKSNVDDSSVSSLGCSRFVVSVANLDQAMQRINISSSQGPTRDKRQKPEVAAPGTDIVAANAFQSDSGSDWISMTGTSMASPFVCGVIGLMLEANPKLTAAQIQGIVRRTSNPLPGADFEWRNDAGYGVVDPDRCVEEAKSLFNRKDVGA